MHRSGTSALTGALECLGVALPSDLLPPMEDNPKGYFEGVQVLEINERILESLQSSYDDTRYTIDIPEGTVAAFLPEVKRFIEAEFQYSKFFALKDPRLCLTFPVWERALTELGISVKIIIPYRNPFEIARSLQKRNDFSVEKGILLWVKYFLHAEFYSRGQARLFVGFNQLLQKTQEKINELAVFTGVELVENSTKSLDNFLDKDLKHHNLGINNVDDNLPDFVKKLIELVEKDCLNQVDTAYFDLIRKEVISTYTFFHVYDVQFHSQISRDLHWQRDQEHTRYEDQVEQNERLAQSKVGLEESLQSQATELVNKQHEIEVLAEEKAQGQTEHVRLNEELDELLQDIESIKEHKQVEKQAYEIQIGEIEQSRNQLQAKLEAQKIEMVQAQQQVQILAQSKMDLEESLQSQATELVNKQHEIEVLAEEKAQGQAEHVRLNQALAKKRAEVDELVQDVNSVVADLAFIKENKRSVRTNSIRNFNKIFKK